MQGEDERIRSWLDEQLRRAGRGAKTSLARHLGKRPEAISRMISDTGELRGMKAGELAQIAAFFKVAPPIFGRPPARGRPEPRQPTDVPLVSWVSAGKMLDGGAAPVETMLAIPDLSPGDYIALTVRGDSMDRLSPEGSIIVVNRREKTPQRGRAYVFAIRGEATYKLWEPDPPRLEPFSTNPANKPIFVDRKRKLFVVGRVRRTFMDL